jgi:hypothetical protein
MYKHTITTMCATVIERFLVLPGLNLVTVREALMIVETIEMFGLVFTATDLFTRTTEIIEIVSWPRLAQPPKTWALANPDRSPSEPMTYTMVPVKQPIDFPISMFVDGRTDCAICGLFRQPLVELAVEIDDAQPDTPDSLLVDHLIDQVAMLKSDLAVQRQVTDQIRKLKARYAGLYHDAIDDIAELKSTIEDRETEVSNALEEIDELSDKLSIAEAGKRIALDRLNVEISKRRDFEAQTEKLTREVAHEKLAREALSDKLAAKQRDFVRIADLYSDLKTEIAQVTLLSNKRNKFRTKYKRKLRSIREKLSRRLDDGDNSILIRELLADLDG